MMMSGGIVLTCFWMAGYFPSGRIAWCDRRRSDFPEAYFSSPRDASVPQVSRNDKVQRHNQEFFRQTFQNFADAPLRSSFLFAISDKEAASALASSSNATECCSACFTVCKEGDSQQGLL